MWSPHRQPSSSLLEDCADFPLNTPSPSENVKAVFGGVNPPPFQTTGALIINTYSVAQLLCRVCWLNGAGSTSPGLPFPTDSTSLIVILFFGIARRCFLCLNYCLLCFVLLYFLRRHVFSPL